MKRTVTFEYYANEFETREDLESLTLSEIAVPRRCVYDVIDDEKEPDEAANSDGDDVE